MPRQLGNTTFRRWLIGCKKDGRKNLLEKLRVSIKKNGMRGESLKSALAQLSQRTEVRVKRLTKEDIMQYRQRYEEMPYSYGEQNCRYDMPDYDEDINRQHENYRANYYTYKEQYSRTNSSPLPAEEFYPNRNLKWEKKEHQLDYDKRQVSDWRDNYTYRKDISNFELQKSSIQSRRKDEYRREYNSTRTPYRGRNYRGDFESDRKPIHENSRRFNAKEYDTYKPQKYRNDGFSTGSKKFSAKSKVDCATKSFGELKKRNLQYVQIDTKYKSNVFKRKRRINRIESDSESDSERGKVVNRNNPLSSSNKCKKELSLPSSKVGAITKNESFVNSKMLKVEHEPTTVKKEFEADVTRDVDNKVDSTVPKILASKHFDNIPQTIKKCTVNTENLQSPLNTNCAEKSNNLDKAVSEKILPHLNFNKASVHMTELKDSVASCPPPVSKQREILTSSPLPASKQCETIASSSLPKTKSCQMIASSLLPVKECETIASSLLPVKKECETIASSAHLVKKQCDTIASSPLVSKKCLIITLSPLPAREQCETVTSSPLSAKKQCETIALNPLAVSKKCETIASTPLPASKQSEVIASSPLFAKNQDETIASSPLPVKKLCEEIPSSPIPAKKLCEEIPSSPIPAKKPCEEIPSSPLVARKQCETIASSPPVKKPCEEIASSPIPAKKPCLTIASSPLPAKQCEIMASSPLPAKKPCETVASSPLSAKKPCETIASSPLSAKKPCETIASSVLSVKKSSETIASSPLPAKKLCETITSSPLPAKKPCETIASNLLPAKMPFETIASSLPPARIQCETVTPCPLTAKKQCESIVSSSLPASKPCETVPSSPLPAREQCDTIALTPVSLSKKCVTNEGDKCGIVSNIHSNENGESVIQVTLFGSDMQTCCRFTKKSIALAAKQAWKSVYRESEIHLYYSKNELSNTVEDTKDVNKSSNIGNKFDVNRVGCTSGDNASESVRIEKMGHTSFENEDTPVVKVNLNGGGQYKLCDALKGNSSLELDQNIDSSLMEVSHCIVVETSSVVSEAAPSKVIEEVLFTKSILQNIAPFDNSSNINTQHDSDNNNTNLSNTVQTKKKPVQVTTEIYDFTATSNKNDNDSNKADCSSTVKSSSDELISSQQTCFTDKVPLQESEVKMGSTVCRTDSMLLKQSLSSIDNKLSEVNCIQGDEAHGTKKRRKKKDLCKCIVEHEGKCSGNAVKANERKHSTSEELAFSESGISKKGRKTDNHLADSTQLDKNNKESGSSYQDKMSNTLKGLGSCTVRLTDGNEASVDIKQESMSTHLEKTNVTTVVNSEVKENSTRKVSVIKLCSSLSTSKNVVEKSKHSKSVKRSVSEQECSNELKKEKDKSTSEKIIPKSTVECATVSKPSCLDVSTVNGNHERKQTGIKRLKLAMTEKTNPTEQKKVKLTTKFEQLFGKDHEDSVGDKNVQCETVEERVEDKSNSNANSITKDETGVKTNMVGNDIPWKLDLVEFRNKRKKDGYQYLRRKSDNSSEEEIAVANKRIKRISSLPCSSSNSNVNDNTELTMLNNTAKNERESDKMNKLSKTEDKSATGGSKKTNRKEKRATSERNEAFKKEVDKNNFNKLSLLNRDISSRSESSVYEKDNESSELEQSHVQLHIQSVDISNISRLPNRNIKCEQVAGTKDIVSLDASKESNSSCIVSTMTLPNNTNTCKSTVIEIKIMEVVHTAQPAVEVEQPSISTEVNAISNYLNKLCHPDKKETKQHDVNEHNTVLKQAMIDENNVSSNGFNNLKSIGTSNHQKTIDVPRINSSVSNNSVDAVVDSRLNGSNKINPGESSHSEKLPHHVPSSCPLASTPLNKTVNLASTVNQKSVKLTEICSPTDSVTNNNITAEASLTSFTLASELVSDNQLDTQPVASEPKNPTTDSQIGTIRVRDARSLGIVTSPEEGKKNVDRNEHMEDLLKNIPEDIGTKLKNLCDMIHSENADLGRWKQRKLEVYKFSPETQFMELQNAQEDFYRSGYRRCVRANQLIQALLCHFKDKLITVLVHKANSLYHGKYEAKDITYVLGVIRMLLNKRIANDSSSNEPKPYTSNPQSSENENVNNTQHTGLSIPESQNIPNERNASEQPYNSVSFTPQHGRATNGEIDAAAVQGRATTVASYNNDTPQYHSSSRTSNINVHNYGEGINRTMRLAAPNVIVSQTSANTHVLNPVVHSDTSGRLPMPAAYPLYYREGMSRSSISNSNIPPQGVHLNHSTRPTVQQSAISGLLMPDARAKRLPPPPPYNAVTNSTSTVTPATQVHRRHSAHEISAILETALQQSSNTFSDDRNKSHSTVQNLDTPQTIHQYHKNNAVHKPTSVASKTQYQTAPNSSASTDTTLTLNTSSARDRMSVQSNIGVRYGNQIGAHQIWSPAQANASHQLSQNSGKLLVNRSKVVSQSAAPSACFPNGNYCSAVYTPYASGMRQGNLSLSHSQAKDTNLNSSSSSVNRNSQLGNTSETYNASQMIDQRIATLYSSTVQQQHGNQYSGIHQGNNQNAIQYNAANASVSQVGSVYSTQSNENGAGISKLQNQYGNNVGVHRMQGTQPHGGSVHQSNSYPAGGTSQQLRHYPQNSAVQGVNVHQSVSQSYQGRSELSSSSQAAWYSNVEQSQTQDTQRDQSKNACPTQAMGYLNSQTANNPQYVQQTQAGGYLNSQTATGSQYSQQAQASGYVATQTANSQLYAQQMQASGYATSQTAKNPQYGQPTQAGGYGASHVQPTQTSGYVTSHVQQTQSTGYVASQVAGNSQYAQQMQASGLVASQAAKSPQYVKAQARVSQAAKSPQYVQQTQARVSQAAKSPQYVQQTQAREYVASQAAISPQYVQQTQARVSHAANSPQYIQQTQASGYLSSQTSKDPQYLEKSKQINRREEPAEKGGRTITVPPRADPTSHIGVIEVRHNDQNSSTVQRIPAALHTSSSPETVCQQLLATSASHRQTYPEISQLLNNGNNELNRAQKTIAYEQSINGCASKTTLEPSLACAPLQSTSQETVIESNLPATQEQLDMSVLADIVQRELANLNRNKSTIQQSSKQHEINSGDSGQNLQSGSDISYFDSLCGDTLMKSPSTNQPSTLSDVGQTDDAASNSDVQAVYQTEEGQGFMDSTEEAAVVLDAAETGQDDDCIVLFEVANTSLRTVSRDSGYITPSPTVTAIKESPSRAQTQLTNEDGITDAEEEPVVQCAVCENPAELICVGCNFTCYCSNTCQVADWEMSHHAECSNSNTSD